MAHLHAGIFGHLQARAGHHRGLRRGWGLRRGGAQDLRHRGPTMDELVPLGSGAVYCFSIPALFTGEPLYFNVASSIVPLILLERLLEARAKMLASEAIEKLAQLSPRSALKVVDGAPRKMPPDEVQHGDLLLVSACDQIPVDGEGVEGESAVDRSMYARIVEAVKNATSALRAG